MLIYNDGIIPVLYDDFALWKIKAVRNNAFWSQLFVLKKLIEKLKLNLFYINCSYTWSQPLFSVAEV